MKREPTGFMHPVDNRLYPLEGAKAIAKGYEKQGYKVQIITEIKI